MTRQKLLIFSEDKAGVISNLNHSLMKNFSVVSTSKMLDAIQIIKNDNIIMVLAVGNFSGPDKEAFKSVIKLLRPEANLLFIKPGSEASGVVTLSGDDFCRYLRNSTNMDSSFNDRLMVFKEFFMSFADRMLQIFGATNSYFFNMDHLMAHLSKKTALALGLDDELASNIEIAALLRDLGMLSIQQQLLDEKRRFSTTELTSIKKHPENTVQILKQIKFPWKVDSVILQHHENYDGSGYPNGDKGRAICIGARIVHLADSYVAMTAKRPYRMPLSHDEAREEIIRNIGTQFDPEVSETFLTVLDDEISHKINKKTVLVFEAEPNITTVMKLSLDMNKFNVIHATNIAEVLEVVKLELPSLTAVDVKQLNNETIITIFNSMYEIPSFENCPFIFVLTDPDFPRQFSGENVRYLTMPIDIGTLKEEFKELFSDEIEEPKEEDGGSKGLRGSLDDFNLADIVQILHLGLKTARVNIKSSSHSGKLYIQRGNIVHATTNNHDGKEAFFEMMSWPAGTFHIHHGIQPETNNITSKTTYLLLESAKIIDEMSR